MNKVKQLTNDIVEFKTSIEIFSLDSDLEHLKFLSFFQSERPISESLF